MTLLNCHIYIVYIVHIVHTEDQSAEIAMQQMDQQYAPLHLVSMISKYGSQQQVDNAKDSDLLTKERLCRALSMFEVVMQRIKAILMKNELVSAHLKRKRRVGW